MSFPRSQACILAFLTFAFSFVRHHAHPHKPDMCSCRVISMLAHGFADCFATEGRHQTGGTSTHGESYNMQVCFEKSFEHCHRGIEGFQRTVKICRPFDPQQDSPVRSLSSISSQSKRSGSDVRRRGGEGGVGAAYDIIQIATCGIVFLSGKHNPSR